MFESKKLLWLDYVAVAIIVIAFFVISYCGYYNSDDLSMAYGGTPTGFGERIMEISSIIDVFKLTRWWYFHFGGRLFSVAAQYFFCGLLGNRVWFDIANTLFFMLLIIMCGRLISNNDKNGIHYVLVFALLFWFLCPVPAQTFFLTACSTTYLWANTLSFVFLLLFQKYKSDNFGIMGKMGLCLVSFFAATEFITCVSICGAFVVYYVFHVKEFKRNAVPFVVGFALGSMLLLFAPGNFIRASWGMTFYDKIRELIFNPIQEIIKYKALWMFLIVLVLGWIKNKTIVETWMRNNAVLLLSLGWSVIAFSVVFRPATRALFFTETLSLILILRFVFGNYHVFGMRFFDAFLSLNTVKRAIIGLLFIVFILDAAFAINETKKQSINNEILLEEIVNSGGIVALDRMTSSYRMAYAPSFGKWTWEPLADRFGLDSVCVYPFYCLNKYYKQEPPLENIFIDKANYENDNDVFGKYVRLIVRIKNENLHESNHHVFFTINYSRPKKWYKSWLDKWRNYQFDRTVTVEVDKPECCFEGYCYYIIWLKRENAKNLKSVRYEFK